MKLARVWGTVVSTINSPVFDHRRLLICDLLGFSGDPTGGYVIAVDGVGAGDGETVLVLDEGTGARQIVGMDPAPIRAVIVGIVDSISGE